MTENLSNWIVPSWNHKILYLMLLSYYTFADFHPERSEGSQVSKELWTLSHPVKPQRC